MMNLPSSWESVPIGDLCELINGRAFKPTDWTKHGLPIVRIQNLNNPNASFNHYEGDVRERFLIDSDDLLFAWSGTPGTSFGAHVWRGGKAVLNQHIFKVVFDRTKIDKDFFQLAINQTLDELINKAHGGVGLRHVTKGKFEETKIALPPFAEQRRLVEKLKRLSSGTERARRELDCVPLLIEHYKRAILTAAFRGELSAEWRHSQPGRASSRAVDGLPSGWKTKALREIGEIQSGLALGKKRRLNEKLIDVPYLRVANVQRGYLDLEEVKTLRATKNEIDRLLLKPGDILMNEGGDRDKLGRGWIWNGEVRPCIHQNHVFRVRLYDEAFPPKYVSYFANEFGQEYFFDEGTQTTNLASISKTKVSGLPLPIPSVAEANEIVRRIEVAFRWVEALTDDLEQANELIVRLDKAILDKAFRGELIPQDPNDEPASVLVNQIRKMREQQTQSGAPGGIPRLAEQKKESKGWRTKAMAKRRSEVEADHLRATLDGLGGKASAKEVWQRSGMDIDEFYKQLRQELKAGHISEGESKDQLVLAHAA